MSAGTEGLRFAENHQWFEEHLSDLLTRYRGRFVAVDRGAVLADARDLSDLARRFGGDPGVLIEKVVRPEDEMLYVL